MGKSLQILIVADAALDAGWLLAELERGGYEPTVERVDTPAAMSAALGRQAWEVILSSASLPNSGVLSALAVLKDSELDIPFVVASDAGNAAMALAAMKAGAQDYVTRSDAARLVPVIEREMRAAVERAARKLTEAALREAEAKHRTLVAQIPAGVHIMALTEAGGGTLSVNPQLERMLGFSAAEWKADPDLWQEQLHPEDRERVLGEMERLQAPGAEAIVLEYRMLARDGQTVWLRDESVVVRDPAGRPQFLQSVKLDLSERRRAEAALEEANEKLAHWVNQLEQHNREITLLNEMGTHLQSCLTLEEAYAVIADFAPLLFPAEAGALYVHGPSRTSVEAVAVWGEAPPQAQVFAPDECWALRKGRVHLVEDPRAGQVCAHLSPPVATGYLCLPMMAQGEALGVLHLQRSSQGTSPLGAARARLTEAKQRLALTVAEHVSLALANLKLRESLHIQSSRDPLTGLFNRRYMEETLERELRRAARKQRPLGVIMLDLDHFERFNETYGREAGDALLQQLGSSLQTYIRGEDVACRYSGAAFTLILPEAPLEVTLQRAEQLRETCKSLHVEHRGQTLERITLSLGVAVFPDDGSTVEAVLRAAAAALYRAKAEGRDRVVGAQSIAVTAREAAEGGAAGDGASPDESAVKPDEAPQRVVVGPLSLNCQTFELTIGDKVILPTPMEYEVLLYLMRHAGKVFTAEQLLQEVWHYPPGTGSQEVVRAHIKNLRSKLEPNPRRPIYLKTIGRFGYTIAVEETLQA
jgi:diguanylate cyclase (GGDEF)-like protein/PAS domain S-box-containing protein